MNEVSISGRLIQMHFLQDDNALTPVMSHHADDNAVNRPTVFDAVAAHGVNLYLDFSQHARNKPHLWSPRTDIHRCSHAAKRRQTTASRRRRRVESRRTQQERCQR